VVGVNAGFSMSHSIWEIANENGISGKMFHSPAVNAVFSGFLKTLFF
jgi:hypothetical protein